MTRYVSTLQRNLGRLICLVCAISIAITPLNGRAVADDPRSDRAPTFGPETGSATAAELIEAMDIPTDLVVSASLGSSDPTGTQVFATTFSVLPNSVSN